MRSRHVFAGIALLIVGAAAMLAFYFARPWLEDFQQRITSDAGSASDEISIGVDNWVGYFPLCSPVLKKRLREKGVRIRCVDDQADYAGRMAALREGELDFAVATIDSYLLNGPAARFPGTIVAVIDESKGGDAVVARKSAYAGIDALKGAGDLKVAFTPGSPSEHLLKAIATHFDIPQLRTRGPWRVETDGSSDAREKLEAGTVDVAVLWEPDVSRALANEDLVKLLGTEDTAKLIVDVLLVGRDFSQDESDKVKLLLHHYFRTLKHYKDHPDELAEHLAEATRLERDQVAAMLKGVAWTNLHDNGVRWFGLQRQGQFSRDGIVDAIESTLQILTESGDFDANPLPDEDPYRILHSEPLQELFAGQGDPAFGLAPSSGAAEAAGPAKTFGPLDAAGWAELREIGTLKVHPITFQSGTARLGLEGKAELDKAANNLAHYPNFRIIVKGHTGLRGDPKANQQLSRERADAVAKYLQITHGITANRMRSVGIGAAEPLARQAGESARAYQYRLPRVEMFLVTEVY